jgi:hypothetical protein
MLHDSVPVSVDSDGISQSRIAKLPVYCPNPCGPAQLDAILPFQLMLDRDCGQRPLARIQHDGPQ